MTMTSLALIATTVAADGVRRLARADCAAVHLALQDRENAVAFCPAGDEVAIEYALAAAPRGFSVGLCRHGLRGICRRYLLGTLGREM
mgnify:CR=1 FL=1